MGSRFIVYLRIILADVIYKDSAQAQGTRKAYLWQYLEEATIKTRTLALWQTLPADIKIWQQMKIKTILCILLQF